MKKVKLNSLKGTDEYDYIINTQDRIKEAQNTLDRFNESGISFPSGLHETDVDVAKRILNTLPLKLHEFKARLGVE